MNKLRTRITLAFMFLVMAQMACSCSVTKYMNTFVYEDLNGSGLQNAGETGFSNTELGSWGTGFLSKNISTNAEGHSNQTGTEGNNECHVGNIVSITPPNNYRVTEQSGPGSWDCSRSNMVGFPVGFESSPQTKNMKVGLAPNIAFTKSGSPSTFSAAGQTITYSYEIQNPASVSLEQIMVTDDKATVTCPGTTAPAGGSLTCSATYVTTEQDVANGLVRNTARFTGVFTGTSLNYSSSTVSFTVTLVVQSVALPPVLTGSVLTGEVITLCDTVNRPVNLRLASGTDPALVTQELANGNLHITIAGTDISSTCRVNASNNTLLTCTYPSGITALPVEGQVIYRNNVVKTFSFQGENGCVAPPSGGGSNDEPPPATEPPAIEPPVDGG